MLLRSPPSSAVIEGIAAGECCYNGAVSMHLVALRGRNGHRGRYWREYEIAHTRAIMNAHSWLTEAVHSYRFERIVRELRRNEVVS